MCGVLWKNKHRGTHAPLLCWTDDCFYFRINMLLWNQAQKKKIIWAASTEERGSMSVTCSSKNAGSTQTHTHRPAGMCISDCSHFDEWCWKTDIYTFQSWAEDRGSFLRRSPMATVTVRHIHITRQQGDKSGLAEGKTCIKLKDTSRVALHAFILLR